LLHDTKEGGHEAGRGEKRERERGNKREREEIRKPRK
jgi:hypothetical protein